MASVRGRPPLQWTQDMWLESTQRYRNFVLGLFENTSFLSILSQHVDPSDTDALAAALVNVGFAANAVLPFVLATTKAEFEGSGKCGVGAILRSNSLASKIQSFIARRIGSQYFAEVLGHKLLKIITSDESFEVDPSKCSSLGSPEEVEVAVAQNRRCLERTTEEILDVITAPQSLEKMPPLLRSVASIILSCAEEHGLSGKATILVGGFLMLRFFSPGILTPDSFGLVPFEVTIPPAKRRNLLLVTKLLQNLSNSVEFGSKEVFMVPLNSCYSRNVKRVHNFLKRVGQANGGASSKESAKADLSDFEIHSVELSELFCLHRIVAQVVDKVLPQSSSVVTVSTTPDECLSQYHAFCDLVRRLGQAPLSNRTRFGASAFDVSAPSKAPAIDAGGQVSAFKLLDDSQFFYRGPNAKKGEAVFYLIFSRVPEDIFGRLILLPAYILYKAEHALDSPYVLVVDMSWSRMTADMQRRIFGAAGGVTKHFTRPQRKNLKKVFVVHPSSFTRAVVRVLRPFTSRKLARKIVNVHDWKDLRPSITDTAIALPDESRDFITKSYPVTKVNAKGKRQERIIKFTTHSLLNVNPSSRLISNERELKDIVEISANQDELSIELRFDESLVGRSVVSLFSNDEDRRRRRYVFRRIEDLNGVVEDIFESAFYGTQFPPEFDVIKINERGQRQKRKMLLTKDSVLNVKDTGGGGRVIKREISFAGLERVELELEPSGERGTVWILYKTDKQPRALISSQAVLLFSAIQEGMKKYERAEACKERETISAEVAVVGESVDDGLGGNEMKVGRLRGMTMGMPRPEASPDRKPEGIAATTSNRARRKSSSMMVGRGIQRPPPGTVESDAVDDDDAEPELVPEEELVAENGEALAELDRLVGDMQQM